MAHGPFEDDADLLRGCIERDEAAWSAFIAKYSALISIAAKKRLRKYGFTLPREDIHDIRQDVLESIWKSDMFKSVRNASSLSYWLAIVSGNAAMLHMRKKRRLEGPLRLSLSDSIGGQELAELLASTCPDPATALENDELSDALDAAIESLPEKERLIIKLNLIHEKKYEEISGMLGLPIGTVCSYVKRAREKLKKYLNKVQ